MTGERAAVIGGALPVVVRILVLGLLAGALVVHHGTAMPGHGPASVPAHGGCVSCDHDGSSSDALLVACVAIGAAALLAPRRPDAAPGRAVIPMVGTPRAVPAPASLRLRAPPPPPDIDRLCVRLR